MRHIKAVLFVVSVTAVVHAEEPLYVLEYPGIAFDWLTSELNPPVEGVLAEDEGAVASSPTSLGVEYHIHYWREDMSAGQRTGDWLEQRLLSVLPPDLTEDIVVGDVTWIEGSMESPHRDDASIGLVVSLNFNVITETGAVLARGRGFAFFVNGYSVLLYGISPEGIFPTAGQVLEEIIEMAYVAED